MKIIEDHEDPDTLTAIVNFVNQKKKDLENIEMFWLWLCTDCLIEKIRILLEGFLLERSGARWPERQ